VKEMKKPETPITKITTIVNVLSSVAFSSVKKFGFERVVGFVLEIKSILKLNIHFWILVFEFGITIVICQFIHFLFFKNHYLLHFIMNIYYAHHMEFPCVPF
jgi:hypothetical protein